jgi:ubiquitin carboxyl-terminal hydrolase L3
MGLLGLHSCNEPKKRVSVWNLSLSLKVTTSLASNEKILHTSRCVHTPSPLIQTDSCTENNPEVLTPLSHSLGLSKDLAFHDVFSLDDPDLLSFVPRPALALLVILPMTPAWYAEREKEDNQLPIHQHVAPNEPVMWFKQTIANACGSMGVLHCILSGEAKKYVVPESIIDRIRKESERLHVEERAQKLYENAEFEKAHHEVASGGETKAPDAEADIDLHFVAFVKGEDGHLYELEGNRKGPLNRGHIGTDDVLSEKALKLGIRRIIDMCGQEDCRYSITALA